MARVALMYVFMSFFRFWGALFRMLRLMTRAQKCDGSVDCLTLTQESYQGKKNDTLYVYQVHFDDGSTAEYREVVHGDRDPQVMEGVRYRFYLSDGNAELIQAVNMKPVKELLTMVGCIGIVLLCFLLLSAIQ